MNNTISQDILPYKKLALLGIDRKMANALPEEVRSKLVNGEVTPLLQVSIATPKGMTVTLPLKLQLASDDNGKVLLLAYPVRKEMSNHFALSEAERERLSKGEVIQKAIADGSEKSRYFLQLDPETRSIIYRRISDVKIEKKLKDLEKVNDIELGAQQKQRAREGKPVELNVGGEKVSVGVDLQSPQGIKVVNGDLNEWEKMKKIRYDITHPEYLGLVHTDKNRWEYQRVIEHDLAANLTRITTVDKSELNTGIKI